jgi:hypothetical protein
VVCRVMAYAEGAGAIIPRYRLTGDAEVMTTAFGFTPTAGGTLVDFLAVGPLVADAYVQEIHGPGIPGGDPASLQVGWTLQDVVIEANPSDSVPIRIEVPINLVGTNAGQGPPNNVTLLVRKQSALAGRTNRGRSYLPPYGLQESEVDRAGFLTGAFLTTFQATLDAFLLEVQTDGADLTINHAQPLVGPIPAPTVVTSLIIDQRVATQRRRLRS